MIFHKYQFYSFSRGAKELFTSSLPFSPIPQIQALYNIVGLTTAVYSSRMRLNNGPQVNTIIYNTTIKAAAPLQVAYMVYIFQFSLVSTQTPKTLRMAFSLTLQLQILTINIKSLFTLFFLIKWMSWYLFSINLTLYYFAYIIYLLYTQFNLIQFSTVVSSYIIRFVLFTNPRAIVSQLLLNISRSLNIKNRNKIGKREDPYKIPIGVNIFLLL